MENELDLVAIRLVNEKKMISKESLKTPNQIVDFFGKQLITYNREVIAMINFTRAMQPINASIVTMGSVHECLLAPAELFKVALLSNADSFVMLHNHPAGSAYPSIEDNTVTRNMIAVSKLLGIEMMDHIIVCDNRNGIGLDHFSYREKCADMFELSGSEALSKTQDIITKNNIAVAENNLPVFAIGR